MIEAHIRFDHSDGKSGECDVWTVTQLHIKETVMESLASVFF